MEPLRPATKKPIRTTNRSCESCRFLKMRCIPENASMPYLTCTRCAKTGKECIFVAPKQRRPRKRADTRVAELEKEIKGMRDLLKSQQSSIAKDPDAREPIPHASPETTYADADALSVADLSLTPAPSASSSAGHTLVNTNSSWGWEVRETPKHGSSPPGPQEPSLNANPPNRLQSAHLDPDVIERGLLTLEHAKILFCRFETELIPMYPGVAALPPGTSAEKIREEKPILFLSILAVAANASEKPLYSALNMAITETYAEQIVIKGRKSLELVQSLIISAIWNTPPDNARETKYYQTINMAGIMVLDLGVDKVIKHCPNEFPHPGVHRELGNGQLNTTLRAEHLRMPSGGTTPLYDGAHTYEKASLQTLESQRVLLVCYLVCSGVAVSMRRPNILRWTTYMQDCLEKLEKKAEYPTDPSVVAWVKLQRIMEEAATAFKFDEPNEYLCLGEPRVQLTLKAFERQLLSLKKSLDPKILGITLSLNFHLASVNLHEIAISIRNEGMHTTHGPSAIKESQDPRQFPSFTPAHVDAVMICIDSCHSVLEGILSMDIPILRAVPILYYVRMQYCVMILIMMDLSTRFKINSLATILDWKTMEVESYMNKLVPQLAIAIGEGVCRPASTFLKLLLQVRAWYLEAICPKGSRDVNKRPDDTERGPAGTQAHAYNHTGASSDLPLGDMNQMYQNQTANNQAQHLTTSDLVTPEGSLTNITTLQSQPRSSSQDIQQLAPVPQPHPDPNDTNTNVTENDDGNNHTNSDVNFDFDFDLEMFAPTQSSFGYLPMDLESMLQPQMNLYTDTDMSGTDMAMSSGFWTSADDETIKRLHQMRWARINGYLP